MSNAVKTIYWWIGLIFTIVGLIPLFPATWYGGWGRWPFLGVGLIIVFLWSPFKVWKQIKEERDRLQAQIDSKEAQVKLTNFDNELRYRIMTGSRNQKVIVIRLFAILRNTSMQNHGSLDFFRIEIPTSRGSFIAKSDVPPLGYKFEPNSIYKDKCFVFNGDLADPVIGIESWEPFIQGKEGRINLAVQGQKIRTYPIKIADKEGF